MQVTVFLLVAAFVIGGTPLGRQIRARPVVLLMLSTIAAISFYSLRVVL